MKKYLLIATAAVALDVLAFGEAGQWSSGWGQGVSEYTAVVDARNSLYIACSDDRPVSMTLLVNGVSYGTDSKKSFDLVVDGRTLQTPYVTGSRVGDDIFRYTWAQLRKAKSVVAKTSDGKTLALPVKGASKVLPGKNSVCKTEFEM